MDPIRAQAVAKVLGDFVDFIEWVYEVAIPIAHRQVLQAEVLNSWSDPDQSTRQLVTYVHDLRSIVARAPFAGRTAYRGQAQQIFRDAFSALEPNGRGRVLAVLHRTLEQLRPGCTGVLLAIAPAAAAPLATAPAPLSPVHQPGVMGAPMATQPAYPVAPQPAVPLAAQPPQAVAPAPVPNDLQIRMDVDTREQNMAREKYHWDSIHRNVMSIWR